MHKVDTKVSGACEEGLQYIIYLQARCYVTHLTLKLLDVPFTICSSQDLSPKKNLPTTVTNVKKLHFKKNENCKLKVVNNSENKDKESLWEKLCYDYLVDGSTNTPGTYPYL